MCKDASQPKGKDKQTLAAVPPPPLVSSRVLQESDPDESPS